MKLKKSERSRWNIFFKIMGVNILLFILLSSNYLQASHLSDLKLSQLNVPFNEVISFLPVSGPAETPSSFIHNIEAIKLIFKEQDILNLSCIALSRLTCMMKNFLGISLFIESKFIHYFIERFITETLSQSVIEQLFKDRNGVWHE